MPPYNKMLIIADPAGNLPSAHREGMHLKQFAKKSSLEIQLIASGQRSKILDAIKTSSIVHFAGHSFDTGSPHSTGWEIGPDMVLDLTAIEEIGKNFSVPWLIFSNSCHASNCSEGSNLSGIAGAFLKAGVSQVVAPIKRINDGQALEFARSFYKYLFKGKTPAESILASKQEMQKINTNSVTHLLYRLYGDPRFNPRASDLSTEVSQRDKKSLRLKLMAWALLVIGIVFALLLVVNSLPPSPEPSTLKEIRERGELCVGIDPGYKPFAWEDEKGNIVGFDIDVVEKMAKEMGVELVLVKIEWDEIIPALLDKKIDIIMSGMTITPDRNLKINFADPYIVVGQTVLLNKKHDGKVKTYKDLNKSIYTVTSKLGTTGEQAVKDYIPKCTYKSFKTEEEAVQEVIDGRADAFVYDKPCCAVFMKEKGADRLVFLDEPFTYEPLAWGIRKGDLDFLNWLNNFLRQIKNDGRYEKIKNKWIRSNDCYNEIK